MKGRCPVHQGYMAGRRPVACLSLRWLHASCAMASAALRPAGRAARAGYGRVLDAAHEQNRGHAGPGLMRVRSAAAKYRVWRRTLADYSASREWRQRGWRACSCLQPVGSPGSWWSCDEAPGGIVPCGAFGVRRAACGRSRARDLPSGLCWSACCADRVRGCPCYLAAGSPRARTYSGQRRCGQITRCCLSRSEGIWRCRQERTVKPSAQPTLVRTQHLPHQRKQPLISGDAMRGCRVPVRSCPTRTGRLRLAGANTGRSLTGPTPRPGRRGGHLR